MDINAKISFVTPAYNASDTLTESIESIMEGNFEAGDECIIVNDGSTDDTPAVIAKLQKKYPVIKVVNQENKGCPAARNTGYSLATNPVIFNLYADDVLEIGSVPKLKKYMIEENADMAAFAEDRYFQKTKHDTTHTWVSLPGVFTLADFLAGDISPAPGGDYMFTKAIWEKVGGVWEYGKGLYEAWGFTLKVLANGAKMVIMPNSYYFHRYGYDSLTLREVRKSDENALMATKMIWPFLDMLTEEDANYIRSEKGGKEWYNGLKSRPIHLKSGESTRKKGFVKRPWILKLKMKLVDTFPGLFSIYLRLKGK